MSMKKTSLEKSIIDTFSYFQVFNYILKIQDLHLFFHSKKEEKISEIKKVIVKNHWIKNNYIVIARKDWKTYLKIQNEKGLASVSKMRLARIISNILKLIPSIKLIGVSGNLAMMNAGKDDDIDIFLITAGGTAWTSRLIVSLILLILGKRRMFKSKNVNDKICLNFILDENNLELFKKNIYSAHEIAQMKVLYDRGNSYLSFIKANEWGRQYLANFWNKQIIKQVYENRNFIEIIFIRLFQILEYFARFIQFHYMKKKITNEVVKNGVMMFHPRDYSREIIKKYKHILSSLSFPRKSKIPFRARESRS
jgi:hypothetical protein